MQSCDERCAGDREMYRHRVARWQSAGAEPGNGLRPMRRISLKVSLLVGALTLIFPRIHVAFTLAVLVFPVRDLAFRMPPHHGTRSSVQPPRTTRSETCPPPSPPLQSLVARCACTNTLRSRSRTRQELQITDHTSTLARGHSDAQHRRAPRPAYESIQLSPPFE